MSKGTICNKCGKKFDMWDESEGYGFHRKLGYGTIYDGMTLKLNLCCSCMESLIAACSVSPFEGEETEE